jgi:hypothetical protein
VAVEHPSDEQPTHPAPTASGRWQRLARVAWVALVLLTVWLFSFGIPVFYRQLQTICTAEPCYASPTAEAARAWADAGLSTTSVARITVALILITALVNGAVATAIFWRKTDDRMAVLTAVALLTFGTFGVHAVAWLYGVVLQFHPFWRIPVYSLDILGTSAFGLLFFIFPDGRFVPGWLRWPAVAWVVWQALVVIFPGSGLDPATWPPLPFIGSWLIFLSACIFAQWHRYRHVSNYRQRQQTKWVVLGIVLALGGAMVAAILAGLGPALGPSRAFLAGLKDTSYYPFLLLVPLSIGVAILRSRLYDIDVVINRALVYGLLSALLALIYGALVIALQGLFSLITGPTPALAVIISTLAIVALFQPLRRSVQAFIDRRFYRSKYDAQQVLAHSASLLRDEVNLDDLTGVLLGVVEETMQPAQVSLVLRDSGAQPWTGQVKQS